MLLAQLTPADWIGLVALAGTLVGGLVPYLRRVDRRFGRLEKAVSWLVRRERARLGGGPGDDPPDESPAGRTQPYQMLPQPAPRTRSR